ncbi:MAG: complex I NDUFA9 subunit family protein, partial [Rhodovarius sp.]|nr:complex I NDUFA9 subunit family protein [Rhodovarius sp.]
AAVVVNLVGILAEPRPGAFRAVQAEGAGRVARLSAAAGVERLVHVSAIGADPAGPAEYARTKAEGEGLVLAAFPTATILRPSIVFGPEDGFFNRFAGLARLAPVMPVICGDTRFQPVYVGDVADAVMAALVREDAKGRIYELGGPRRASFRELIRYILEVTGRPRKPLFEVPLWLAALQARIGELLPGKPFTRDQLRMLQRDNVVAEGMPGLAELGIEPTPMEAVVPLYLARFRPGGGRAK